MAKIVDIATTRVRFVALAREEEMEACYFNVMGLPVSLVYRCFKEKEAA